jgi:ATP-dependent Clp protease adaptor protein ClpS
MPDEPAEFEETGKEDSTMIAAKAKVWLHDDDTTPVDFVMYVLEHYFGYDEAKARAVVERIRSDGKAVVAELAAVPAELAKQRVNADAIDSGFPLKVTIEGTKIV